MDTKTTAAKNQRADKGEQKDVDMKSVTKIITYFAEDDDKDEQAVANRLKKGIALKPIMHTF